MLTAHKNGRPKALPDTPTFPIEIAGEKHVLKFDMAALAQLELELKQDSLEVLEYLRAVIFGELKALQEGLSEAEKQTPAVAGVMAVVQSAPVEVRRRFRVQVILAALAAGISHEYDEGCGPTWREIGERFSNFHDLQALVPTVMEALKSPFLQPPGVPKVAADPNAQPPAEQSTGMDSTNSPATP